MRTRAVVPHASRSRRAERFKRKVVAFFHDALVARILDDGNRFTAMYRVRNDVVPCQIPYRFDCRPGLRNEIESITQKKSRRTLHRHPAVHARHGDFVAGHDFLYRGAYVRASHIDARFLTMVTLYQLCVRLTPSSALTLIPVVVASLTAFNSSLYSGSNVIVNAESRIRPPT